MARTWFGWVPVTFLRDLLRFAPARHDHLPAARIALGVAVPLGLLVTLGRPDLAVYASFAAFTGVYARHEPLGARVRHQAQAASLLLACVALGVVLADAGVSPWGVVLAGAVVSAVGAVLAAALGLRPAGSLFFTFAVVTVASVRTPAPFGEAMAVAGVTAALSVLLGVLGALLSGRLRPEELSVPVSAPLPESELSWHGLRHVVAAFAGGVAGMVSGVGHSPWAMVAAVAPISMQDQRGRVQRAVQRVLGTLGGAGGAAVLLHVSWSPLASVLWIVGLQFLAELFIARNYSVGLVFVTPLALMMARLASPGSVGELVWARVVETLLGAVVGLLVVLLVRSRAERTAR
ncbi:FUSC family protein [Deinococcus pimensis]|uniref:FUSC family protein n=1 Tax=Deinococcus pimensis TaxID=309888 RepID=UPI0004B25874|nr:FUSC family protein [Deinococcus pimensis]